MNQQLLQDLNQHQHVVEQQMSGVSKMRTKQLHVIQNHLRSLSDDFLRFSGYNSD